MQWTLAIGVAVVTPVMGPFVAIRHAPARDRDMTSAQPSWECMNQQFNAVMTLRVTGHEKPMVAVMHERSSVQRQVDTSTIGCLDAIQRLRVPAEETQ